MSRGVFFLPRSLSYAGLQASLVVGEGEREGAVSVDGMAGHVGGPGMPSGPVVVRRVCEKSLVCVLTAQWRVQAGNSSSSTVDIDIGLGVGGGGPVLSDAQVRESRDV